MSLTDNQFDAPLSNVEGLLQNILGAENEVVPQSRVELILENALGGENEVEPQSRVEELLDRVVDKIKEGGYDLPAVIEPLSVTENGTYSAPSGVDGYSPITVEVAGSGGDAASELIMRTISEYTGNASYIGREAFYYCTNLTSVSFPNASDIGNYAFFSCIRLTDVSFPNVSNIGNYAFQYCGGLTSASFPNVSRIGNSAFQYCYHLISLYLTGGNMSQVPTLSASAFYLTPIGGYSASAGQYGSVYVPASLYSTFLTATNWSSIASRIVSVE